MSMIHTAQWLVTLGRLDIAITVSSLSLYRVACQKGHLKHMKSLYGYVEHFPHAPICIHTENGYTLFMEILKKNCP